VAGDVGGNDQSGGGRDSGDDGTPALRRFCRASQGADASVYQR
jgi:hypothetical protein